MTAAVTRGTVVIDAERCKGCELCIPACPPGVLSMSAELNSTGFRYPLLVLGCTACQACREICPDFVFDVYKFETPILNDELGAILRSARPEPEQGEVSE